MKSNDSFLADLLDLYYKMKHEGVPFAQLEKTFSGSTLNSKVMDELAEEDQVETRLHSGYYEDWWNRFIEDHDENEQAYALHSVLKAIDTHYAARRLTMIELEDGRWLALGPKIWNRGVGNLPPDSECPFRNLRYSRRAKMKLVEHDTLHRGFRRPDREIKIRSHSLSRDTMAFFRHTCDEVGNGVARFVLHELRSPQAGREGGTEENYLDEIGAATAKACAEGVHVLSFPELCITEKARQRIRDEVKKGGCGSLFLVLGGTAHVARDACYENSGPVYVREGDQLEELASYIKRKPFSMPRQKAEAHPGMKEVLAACHTGCCHMAEDIVPAGHFTVMGSGAGLIGVLVCKDALVKESELADLSRFVDHMFIVSMHAAPGWFEPAMYQAQALDRTAYYYVNAHHMQEEGSPLEFAAYVVPRGLPGSGKMEVFYSTEAIAQAQEGRVPEFAKRSPLESDGSSNFVVPLPAFP